jgi:hypothetical protein
MHAVMRAVMHARALPIAALSLACLHVSAAPVTAGPGTCQPFGAAAKREPLSQLLRELSAVRSYRLENWTNDDPIVTRAGGNDMELMETLSRQINLMVRYAPAKDCPGKWKIDTIWILPARPDLQAQRLPPAAPVPSPAEAAATKAGMDMYMHAHGIGKVEPPMAAASVASSAASSAVSSDPSDEQSP